MTTGRTRVRYARRARVSAVRGKVAAGTDSIVHGEDRQHEAAALQEGRAPSAVP